MEIILARVYISELRFRSTAQVATRVRKAQRAFEEQRRNSQMLSSAAKIARAPGHRLFSRAILSSFPRFRLRLHPCQRVSLFVSPAASGIWIYRWSAREERE